MKLAVFNDHRVGAITDDGIHDLTPLLPGWRSDSPAFVNDFIASFSMLRPAIEAHVASSAPTPLASVELRAPVPRPGQVLAAPLNFQAHRDEMTGPLTAGPGTAAELGFFIKSSNSVSDPSGDILLPPLPDRRFDFEAEIAVVVGRTAQAVDDDQILSHVLGYTIVLDMTMRMSETEREERTMRKSFSTFTPMGPWIVTGDEVPNPADLTIRAWRNGELRQDASLAELIVGIPSLLSRASHVLPLRPGDVYASGSPAGVGEVKAGDSIVVECPQIGRLEIGVRSRPW